jgi:hypothetical protein
MNRATWEEFFKEYYQEYMKQIIKDFNMPKSIVKEKLNNNYEFTVQNSNMIDYCEINQELSRQSPLMFIMGDKYIDVKIHESIEQKARILEYQDRPINQFDKNDSTAKTAWIEWVKKVKTAPWGDKKEEIKVKVIFPNI